MHAGGVIQLLKAEFQLSAGQVKAVEHIKQFWSFLRAHS
jgi:hypothetical protein